MAGERSERGEGREGAGCGVPGSTPAELVATHGGGRCGGRGKREEFGPADKVLGQCGKRAAGGAAGKVRRRVTRKRKGRRPAVPAAARWARKGARGFASAVGMWLNGRETRIDPYQTACAARWADLTASGLTGNVD